MPARKFFWPAECLSKNDDDDEDDDDDDEDNGFDEDDLLTVSHVTGNVSKKGHVASLFNNSNNNI
jgi:hypothetical protein